MLPIKVYNHFLCSALAVQLVPKIKIPKGKSTHTTRAAMGSKYLCYDEVTQGSMLSPLPLSNYPYAGRLRLQGEVSVATQGARDGSDPVTNYLAPNKECS